MTDLVPFVATVLKDETMVRTHSALQEAHNSLQRHESRLMALTQLKIYMNDSVFTKKQFNEGMLTISQVLPMQVWKLDFGNTMSSLPFDFFASLQVRMGGIKCLCFDSRYVVQFVDDIEGDEPEEPKRLIFHNMNASLCVTIENCPNEEWRDYVQDYEAHSHLEDYNFARLLSEHMAVELNTDVRWTLHAMELYAAPLQDLIQAIVTPHVWEQAHQEFQNVRRFGRNANEADNDLNEDEEDDQ